MILFVQTGAPEVKTLNEIKKLRKAARGKLQVIVAQRLFAPKRTKLHEKYDHPDKGFPYGAHRAPNF